MAHPTHDELWAQQRIQYPDSIELLPKELTGLVYTIEPYAYPRPRLEDCGADYAIWTINLLKWEREQALEQRQAFSWINICLQNTINMGYQGVFYACGMHEETKRFRYIGWRYGVIDSEYMSGFPATHGGYKIFND